MPSIVTSYRGVDGRSYLAVTTKRSYAIRHGMRAEPTTEPTPVRRLPEYAQGSAGRLLGETELLAGLKTTTDVVLHGTAYSHRGAVPALSAALRVGPVAKSVQVWGDRRIQLAAGGAVSFTSPEPFTTMPLTWERAYGGRDAYAESKESLTHEKGLTLGALSYPRNQYGRGFFLDLDRERLAGSEVPNLDDANDPVRPDRMVVSDYKAWIDCPVAACFEPIDAITFPRALFLLPAAFSTPSRPIHEVVSGVITHGDLARMKSYDPSLHPRALNCAAAGLATHRLYGGERVQLWNLHRDRELFEVDLAGDRPRLVVEPPGVGPRELDPLLQTVEIEPDRNCVRLTWAGAIEVAAVYPRDMIQEMRHHVVWSQRSQP